MATDQQPDQPGHPDQPGPGQPEPGQPEPGQPEPGQPEPGQPEPGQPEPGQPEPAERSRRADRPDGAADPAQAELRGALARLLAPADGGPEPQDLADVLWMARIAGLTPHQPAAPPPAQPGHRARPTAQPPAPDPTPPAAPPAVGTASAPAPEPRVELHAPPGADPQPAHPQPAAPGGGRAQAVRVTRPAALTGTLVLGRALRPLRRLLPAPGTDELDEERTAEATAETGLLLPHWHPTRRPRFAVDLLVDTGATMAPWHGLAGELRTLLERHGAFADVHAWALDTDHEVPALTPFRRRHRARTATAPQPARWRRPLADPTGRRILLVLTDGVGPAWRGPQLPGFLAEATTSRPAAALHVLPRRLWHRTGLRTVPVEARAAAADRPIPVFRTDAPLPGLPRGVRSAEARAAVRWLPVLEIDADWLAPWVELTAGRGSGWTSMLAAPVAGLPRPPQPPQPPGPAADEPPPAADRVARFRAGSSPEAYRLACHLAAVPLSLPVMRLVQRAVVPESGQRELAELFVSGLLVRRGGAVEAADPDEVVYDFRPGVREGLLAELTRTESVRMLELVRAKVSARVAATFGGTLDFGALAAGAAAGEGVALPERSLPFAEVAVAVLGGAGGEHAELARRLGAGLRGGGGGSAGGAALRRELLTPPPEVLSPPDPPRLVGRRGELAAVAEAFSGGSGVVVIQAPPREGKRRLIQEYLREHGDRHPFVHWIRATRVEDLGRGLAGLWSAIGSVDRPMRDLRELWRALGARQPGWLLVLDELSTSSWAVLSPGAWPSNGCVLVTTGVLGGLAIPGAAVLELGPLTVADWAAELTERRPSAPPDLADRLPTRLADVIWSVVDELLADDPPDPVGAGTELASFRLPEEVTAMTTLPAADGRPLLATLGPSGWLRCWDPETGGSRGEPVPLDRSEVVGLAAYQERNGATVLATATRYGRLDLWNPATGALLRTRLPGDLQNRVVAMTSVRHRDGRSLLVVAGEDGTLLLVDPFTDSHSGLAWYPVGYRSGPLAALPGSMGGELLAGVDGNGRVRLWELADPRYRHEFTVAAALGVTAVAGLAPRPALAVVDGDRTVHLLDVAGEVATAERLPSDVPMIRVERDGQPVLLLPARVPRQGTGSLAPVPGFVDRFDELDLLFDQLAPPQDQGGPRRPVLVCGPPGVGKSELVVQAAAMAAANGWFPGGVFRVDLAGYVASPGLVMPATPAEVMSRLLDLLGVPAERLPRKAVELRGLYHAVLATFAQSRRRLLLVFDNVSSASQVAGLLPPDSNAVVLLTSRHRLPLEVDYWELWSLSRSASVEFLRTALRVSAGESDVRVAAEPAAADHLAEFCDGLPLALRICADLLSASPGRPLAELVDRLAEPRHRLDRLGFGDRSVRAAFDQSYRLLSHRQARLFRLLSVHPGDSLSTEVAAVLLDVAHREARDLMAELAEAHLIETDGALDRWWLSGLLRCYSGDLGERREAGPGDDHREQVRAELMAYYRQVLGAAVEQLRGPAPGRGRFSGPEQVLQWLAAERRNLVPIAQAALAGARARADRQAAAAWATTWAGLLEVPHGLPADLVADLQQSQAELLALAGPTAPTDG
ncbi:SAV_2336 N-terminal domain-related protein [Kitasatospora sp. LaBMicrA B282]|uniref:SAV_2336 N-terminal domain-related protein n=1 Tax=Kitasatospora sp. LaBMicrA B282 TaxID=3420949 RepID=UPI003D13F920